MIISMPIQIKQDMSIFLGSELFNSEFGGLDLMVCIVMMTSPFSVDLLRKKYEYDREWVAKRGIVTRWVIWIFLIIWNDVVWLIWIWNKILSICQLLVSNRVYKN